MAPPPPKRAITVDDAPGAPGWLEGVLSPINAFLKPTADALSQGLTFRENFSGEVKVVELTPPEDWIGIPYDSNWTDFGGSIQPFEYRKALDGTVKLRGSFKWTGGGSPSAGTRISPLTAALVTAAKETFGVITESPFAAGALSVRPDGLFFESGNVAAVSTSGLEWGAAERAAPRWESPVEVKLGAPQRPFPGRPGTVILLGCRKKVETTAPAVVTAIDWTAANLERAKASPAIRIHRVWGLVPSVTYLLTLLILPE